MPEIKKTFTQGRMNKDLDERIVPNGEYRDALNVEVTTSEGSNVGAVESLNGNAEVSYKVDTDATCVGILPDEDNNVIYYWVHDAKNQAYSSNPNNNTHESNAIIADAILRYNAPTTPNGQGDIDVIFSDVHHVKSRADVLQAPTLDGVQTNIIMADLTGICVGMSVKCFRNATTELWNFPTDPIVTAITPATNTITLNTSVPAVTQALVLAGVFLTFNHEKALNLQVGGFYNITDDGGVTALANPTRFISKRIHSCNVIDDLLFWTDDNDEPKKINIVRSFDGSVNCQNLDTRTDLYVKGFPNQNAIVVNGSRYINKGPIKKEHITVIRLNPTTPLTIDFNLDGNGEPELRSIATGVFDSNTIPTFTGSFFNSLPGKTMRLVSQTVLDVEVGDVLKLTHSATGNMIVTVFDVDNTSVTGDTILMVSISSASTVSGVGFTSGQTIGSGATGFTWNLIDDDSLYTLSIPRFSYRYRYEDGEYSSYAPFSKPAFLAGAFSLDSEQGQNLGMRNRVRKLTLLDWVPNDIPNDVKEIDILFKDSSSPNIYTVETFNRSESQFTASGTGSHNGSMTITKEKLGAALPSNQLIRPFDNVPRKAKTQEIVANRLTFGNYLESYDLVDSNKNPININLDLDVSKYEASEGSNNNVGLSIKSNRTYELGVVYRDKFGRETPVLTGEKSTIKTDKSINLQTHQLSARIKHNPPYWADSFKFYIKEISNEFYNIAIDRIYPCNDNTNNVWVSFNSADRNKIDEASLLQLKKTHSAGATSGPYHAGRGDYDDEPYKIISIESEVPDSIKIKHKYIQSEGHSILGDGVSGAVGDWCGSPFHVIARSNNPSGGEHTTARIRISASAGTGTNFAQHPAAQSKIGGLWDVLDCEAMYNDWLANSAELEVRVTRVGAQGGSGPTQTDWMKVTAIQDDTAAQGEAGGAGQSGSYFAAPSWLVLAQNYKDPQTNNFVSWRCTGGGMNLTTGGTRIEFREVIRETEEEHLGKFFVKLKQKGQNLYQLPSNANGPNATRDSGIFEVLPKENQADIDIFYEASKAYPISLNARNDEQYINVGDEISIVGKNNGVETAIASTSGAVPVVSSIDADDETGYFQVVSSITYNIDLASFNQGVVVRFTNVKDRSYVESRLAESTFSALATVVSTSAPINNPQANIGGFNVTAAATQGASVNLLLDRRVHLNDNVAPISTVYNSLHTKIGLSWFNCFSFSNGVESDRIRDDFNAPQIDNGVRASTIFENYQEERKSSTLIYSGIYNSISGVNDTNQFIQGEKITKNLNPVYGSIQKINISENNLDVFCEEKCLRVLANKDAVFNADGNPQLIATNRVLGDASPYAGDFGIGDNPESFASYGFRSYFVDRKRGVVVRLSRNGLTAISEVGMRDWFSDNLGRRVLSCFGSYDAGKQEYNISIENVIKGLRGGTGLKEFYTLSYSDSTQGWTSFKSFLQETGCSIGNDYYTTFKGELFKHHIEDKIEITGSTFGSSPTATGSSTTVVLDEAVDFIAVGYVLTGDGVPINTVVTAVNNNGTVTVSNTTTIPFQSTITFTYPTNNFYGVQYNSTLTALLNDSPEAVKAFKTINYEGTQARILENTSDINYYNNIAKNGWYVESINTDQQEGRVNEFLAKEGKWWNNIQGTKTEWVNKQGVQNAKGNVDAREFSVQGIGLSQAVSSDTVSNTGVSSGDFRRMFAVKMENAPDGVQATSNAITPQFGLNQTTSVSGVLDAGTASFLTQGDVGSSPTPLRIWEASNWLSAGFGGSFNFSQGGPPTSTWIHTESFKPTNLGPYLGSNGTVLPAGSLCVIASDFSPANTALNNEIFLYQSGSGGGQYFNQGSSNTNGGQRWGSFPSSAASLNLTTLQAATAANGYIGKYKWTGGWLPSEVAYVTFEDTLYRTNNYDPANTVRMQIYYNGSGTMGPLDVSQANGTAGSATTWYCYILSEGLYGGCRLAMTPLSLLVNSNGTSGLTNSTLTLTPRNATQVGEPRVSPTNTATNFEFEFTPGVEKEILTATFEADSGFYFDSFPKVNIQSLNVENYIVETVDVTKTADEIRTAEATEEEAVKEGGGRKTKDEEKRSEKVDVTVEDDGTRYIVKQIIRISYIGDSFDDSDKINFNHEVEQIP